MTTYQPTKAYTAGIIGLGVMGRIMLNEMNSHPRFEVACAWDPDENACDIALENHSWLEISSDAEKVIGRADVDLIYIASPPRSHSAYAIAACDAGKAVFCEKPLGVDLETSRALLSHVDNAGVISAVNFSHAASSDAEHAHLALKAGDLGKIAYVNMNLHLPAWPRKFQKDAEWLRFRDQGGFTREVLSHWIFLSLRLFGPGELVFARSHFPDDGRLAEDRVIAELDFNGMPVFVNGAVGGRGPVGTEYTVWGSKRSLRLSSGSGMLVYETDGWRPFLESKDAGASDRKRALDNLAALLDGKPNTAASIKQALAVQQIIEGTLAERVQ